MSTVLTTPSAPPADPTRVAAMNRNLNLVSGYLQAMMAAPARMDVIPDGASLVLLPRDDRDGFEANLKIAVSLARQGANVYLRHVHADGSPVPVPAAPVWSPDEG